MILSKNVNVGMSLDIYRRISFRLGIMIETTERYILSQVLDLYLWPQFSERSKTSVLILLQIPSRWPSGKASVSRAEDPGFETRLRRDFFGVESYQ